GTVLRHVRGKVRASDPCRNAHSGVTVPGPRFSAGVRMYGSTDDVFDGPPRGRAARKPLSAGRIQVYDAPTGQQRCPAATNFLLTEAIWKWVCGVGKLPCSASAGP